MIVYGANVLEPRDVQFFGDATVAPLAYGPLIRQPVPFPTILTSIRNAVQSLPFEYLLGQLPQRKSLNCAMVTQYNNQADSMGFHADDEVAMGPQPFLASLTLGDTRPFVFRHNITRQKISCTLSSGALLLMLGASLQQNWKHSLPKLQEPVRLRWNLSFRHHLSQETVQSIFEYKKYNPSMSFQQILNKFLV